MVKDSITSSIENYRKLVRLIRGSKGLEEWERESMLALANEVGITDPLTGLLNKAHLEGRLMEEFSRARRQKYPLS